MRTRRDFLKYLLATPLAMELDVEKLLWVPKPIITVPELPITLWGIPYHQTDATIGSWLGLDHSRIMGISKAFNEKYPELDFSPLVNQNHENK